jgi:transposase
MWLFASIEGNVPIFIFQYDETRVRRVVADALEGWSGTIITDGYAAYDDLGANIRRVSCLVHIRRKFVEVVKAAQSNGAVAPPDAVSVRALTDVSHRQLVCRHETGRAQREAP